MKSWIKINFATVLSKSVVKLPILGSDKSLIKSTRIRVGRNLAGYPLGPGISNEQRMEVMQKVVEACNQFEGDLAGSFYPLDGMNPETQQQLINDHFLFK